MKNRIEAKNKFDETNIFDIFPCTFVFLLTCSLVHAYVHNAFDALVYASICVCVLSHIVDSFYGDGDMQ